jgi:hypothetical protein
MCKPLELAEKVENSKYVSDNVKEVAIYKGRGFGKILVETLLDDYLIAEYSGSQNRALGSQNELPKGPE